MKKDYIIIIGIIIVIIIPIIINEAKLRPKISLINDVKEIMYNIKDYRGNEEVIELIINNGYRLNEKYYKVEGNGVIFIEDEPSVMLSRNGMCAMKLPYSDKVMFQNEECPKYRLVNGEKKMITK